MNTSIFGVIKAQIVSNENAKELLQPYCNIFKVQHIQTGVLNWFVNRKVFAVKQIRSYRENGKFVYEIEYTNLNPENEFFRYSKMRSRLTDDYIDIGERAYSQTRVDEKYFYSDESRYEYLEPEDSCLLEITLNELGYNSFNEYMENAPDGASLARINLSEEIENFYKTKVVKPWEIGEDEEEQEELAI